MVNFNLDFNGAANAGSMGITAALAAFSASALTCVVTVNEANASPLL